MSARDKTAIIQESIADRADFDALSPRKSTTAFASLSHRDYLSTNLRANPMTMFLFDTLKLSRTLQENGRFTPEQANALAEGISSASIDHLATKEDLSLVATRIESLTKTTDSLATKEELKALSAKLDSLGTKEELRTLSTRLDSLATKEELKAISTRLNSLATKEELRILSTRMEFFSTKDDSHAIETRTLRWIVGAGAFQVIAVIIALYLHK